MSAKATLAGSDCHRQCEALGVARVRALLRFEDDDNGPGWRREAQQWLDERLRREGERAYAMVMTSIVLLSTAIVVLALLSWD
ncbi:MAG TPA: hypothetical protein VGC74_04995 [Stenotrophomonas sp.]|jgi:hypothetical protein